MQLARASGLKTAAVHARMAVGAYQWRARRRIEDAPGSVNKCRHAPKDFAYKGGVGERLVVRTRTGHGTRPLKRREKRRSQAREWQMWRHFTQRNPTATHASARTRPASLCSTGACAHLHSLFPVLVACVAMGPSCLNCLLVPTLSHQKFACMF